MNRLCLKEIHETANKRKMSLLMRVKKKQFAEESQKRPALLLINGNLDVTQQTKNREKWLKWFVLKKFFKNM